MSTLVVDVSLRALDERAHKDLVWLPTWSIFVCRPCAIAIRSRHIKSHFRQKHSYTRDELHIVTEATELHATRVPHLPTTLRQAIPYLAIQDGLCCTLSDNRITCRYICLHVRDIRKHCREAHSWTQHKRRGRPGINPPREEVWRSVRCQRVFAMGHDSHYIELSAPSLDSSNEDLPSTSSVWDTAGSRVQAVRIAQEDRIEEGRERGHSAWLSRTGWVRYLSGIARPSLLTLISISSNDTYEQVLCAAVKSLVMKSEWVLRNRCSTYIKTLLTKLNPGQNRVQYLQGYLENQDRLPSIRSWQAILLFFLRTHDGLSEDLRPRFTLLPRQHRYLTDLIQLKITNNNEDPVSSSNDQLSILESACLRFFISLLDQRVDSHEYQSPLVCALALLGLHTGHEGWKGPDRYPSLLSGVIKLARFFVLRYGYEERPSCDRDGGPNVRYIHELVERFMIRGTFGPVEWMIDLRSYGMSIAFNTTAEEKVQWETDRVLYGQIQFTISDLSTAVHRLTNDTFVLLRDQLLFGEELEDHLPLIPWDSLSDEHSNAVIGWSFLKDTRTTVPLNTIGTLWLQHRIQRSDILRTRFQSPRTPNLFRGQAVKSYLRQVQRFLVRLAVLFQLSAQPARVTELLTIRCRNSAQGDPRGILIDDGLVAFVTRYYKGAHYKGDTRLIHRYLPRSIGRLVVYYLWLVLPWVETLEVIHFDSSQISDYLWPDEESHASVSADYLRTKFPSIMQEYLGCEISVREYRHLAISIARHHRISLDYGLSEQDQLALHDGELDDDNIWDLQAAHTTHIAELTYARDLRQLPGERLSRRQDFRRISLQWHSFLGFSSSTTESTLYEQADQDEGFFKRRQRQRWEQLRQSNPTTQLQILYGIEAQFRHNQEEVLSAIHAGHSPILAILPTGGGKSLLFTLPASYDFSRVTVVVVPLVALREDLVRRSHEIQVRACIWQSGVDISHDYQLVFVTVDAAVTDEFLNVLHRLRLRNSLDRIVIDECHLLVMERECNFRPAFTRLYRLATLEVPILCLTATLPVQDEHRLWTALKTRDARGYIYRVSSRLATHRFIVRVTSTSQSQSTIQSLVRVARELGRTIIYCSSVSRVVEIANQVSGLIYHAKYLDKAQSLREFSEQPFGVMVCTQALGLGVHVENVRTIIHTTAPDTLIQYLQECGRGGRISGLEATQVRTQSTSASNIEIESRVSSTTVTCILLHNPVSTFHLSRDPWITRYLNHADRGSCRRQCLSQYLDGDEQPKVCQVQAGEQPCDLCESEKESENSSLTTTHSTVSKTRKRPTSSDISFEQKIRRERYTRISVAHTLATEAASTESFIQWLEDYNLRCFLCLERDSSLAPHSPEECTSVERPLYDTIIATLRGEGLKYAPYSACYGCGIPQKLCDKWILSDVGYQQCKGKTCQANRVIHEATATLFFFRDDERFRQFQHRMTCRIETTSLLPSLANRVELCQMLQWNGFQCTILFREIFYWFRMRYNIQEPKE